MSEPKRLHPIAVLLNIIKSIKELVIPFLLVVVIPGKNEGIPGWIQPLVISIIILLIIGNAFLQWLRFTYRIEEGEFRIESGVFVRKKRYIKFDRIHSIDISEGIIQRVFSLVKLNIETAGGSQADAVLSAISKSDADRINAFISEEKMRIAHLTVIKMKLRIMNLRQNHLPFLSRRCRSYSLWLPLRER